MGKSRNRLRTHTYIYPRAKGQTLPKPMITAPASPRTPRGTQTLPRAIPAIINSDPANAPPRKHRRKYFPNYRGAEEEDIISQIIRSGSSSQSMHKATSACLSALPTQHQLPNTYANHSESVSQSKQLSQPRRGPHDCILLYE